GRLGIDHSGVWLQAASMDAKLDAAAAEGFDVDFPRARYLLEETGTPFKNWRRSGQSGSREPRRENRIASSFRSRQALPVRQCAEGRLSHRNMIIDGDGDRMCELFRRELHQPARGERNRRKTEYRRVPAAV